MRSGSLVPMVGVALLTLALGTGVVQAQQTQTVSMTEFQFAPARLTATAGQPVNWTFKNDGQNPHDFRVEIGGQTIDAVAGDGNVASGQSATFTQAFTTPGTYEFWCPVGMHRQRGMVGTLTIAAAGAAGAPPAQLPRTGELPLTSATLLAGAAGLGSLLTGLLIRRRRQHD
jgi:LPXTG-motif cell wall-anchored protein